MDQQQTTETKKLFSDTKEILTTQTVVGTQVFSSVREITQPKFAVTGLKLNQRQKMDGLKLLKKLDKDSIPLVFFDPQYRTILDKQSYGNEKSGRQKERANLPQMDSETIRAFVAEIGRALIPSGHLMLWVDKYIVCSGVNVLMEQSSLQLVDMITWNKERMGMGYRSRRYAEHLIVFQKKPVRAKGVWRVHNIPDVWSEKIENGNRNHTHAKPIELQKQLIKAVTNEGDIVIDPCAGGYSVFKAAQATARNFLGCDMLG